MVKKKYNQLIKTLNFLVYRFRYLINYMIIGFFSVLLEIIIVKYTPFININFILKIGIGFLSGVLLSFILNAKLNFRVPKSRNTRTFILFLIISTFAFLLNFVLMLILKDRIHLTYGPLRFISAVAVFLLSYTAHRKITFDFVKKVGIAIYLNEQEDISKVYSKIRYYSDFIHLDLIDASFNKNASKIDLSLVKEIDKTWGLEKMIHIMSKKPSIWLEKLKKSVDVIIFHLEIEESVDDIINLCKNYNKKVGICLRVHSDIDSIIKYLPQLDFVQVMGIDELGESGQIFNPESLDKLKKLNKLKKKYSFEIIFDGGVKPTNIWRINAKYIVSSSGLLYSKDPIKSFMELKTSSRYHSIEQQLRNDILREIEQVIESIEFVESGNIVGTFSEEKGIKGISDIDIVLIVDKLTKIKYKEVYDKFERLSKKMQSKYGYKTIINSSFGPLKFNINSLVFHLMVYDTELHKLHCLKSPFTCLDWQRTHIFFKKPLYKIYRVRGLQPCNFLGSRRSATEYLLEIKKNKISYRVYKFKADKITEEKKYKEMNQKERIEFSYHILRFLITNFLKLYHKKNETYKFSKILKMYFKLFPKNKNPHYKFIKDIYFFKESQTFKDYPNLLNKLEFFIKDFESQFRIYFYETSTEILFLRHTETKLKKEEQFIGQKSNPEINLPDKNKIEEIKGNLKDIEIVFSSPSKRCEDTLKLVTDKNPIFEDRLKEIDYGDIDGKNLKYLTSKYPKIIEGWERGEDPRFPHGENSLDVFKRAKEFLNALKNYNNRKILVCTHNVFLRTIIGYCFNIPLKNWFKINIPHFDLIRLIITKDKRFYIDLTDKQIEEIFKNF